MRAAAALRVARGFAIGAVGAAAAVAIGAPLPYMLGAVAANIAAGAFGVRFVRAPRWISTCTRVAIGVLVGSSIGPELLERAAEMGATAVAVPLQVFASILLGTAYLRRASAMTAGERLLGALPGGLASVVASIEETGRDTRRIGVLHTVRVAAVVACIPIALALGLAPEGPATAGQPSLFELDGEAAATLAALALLGWGLSAALRIPGGQLLFPLLVTAAANLTGIAEPTPPRELALAAQLVLGTMLGTRIAAGSILDLRRWVGRALALTGILLACSATIVVSLHYATGLPWSTGILAFAPGGVPEISVVAVSLGIDPGFVVAIHSWRLLLILGIMPFVLRIVMREDAAAEQTRRGRDG